MEQIASIEAIAQVIQLSVAPVFLLAGIAGFLSVLSTRLGRITDRARIIERQIPLTQREEQQSLLQSEISSLWRRIRLINWAIRMCVSGALTICLVIVTLFIGDFVTFNLSILIALLFIVAMLLVISGLVLLLFEVSVSTRRMRQGMEIVIEENPPA
ncbi:MAG: DUF2721 domain-containing protein [Pseudomonadales bacterium]|nr:DUF2721 domain-containing protein [Pseudomonadales bacterium]